MPVRCRGRACGLVAAVLLVSAPAFACVGDCDADGTVRVNELTVSVRIGLDSLDLSACEAIDANRDGQAGIDELVGAVDVALHGCLRGSDGELLYSTQMGQLEVYDLARSRRDVLVPSTRLYVGGQICAVPDGSGNLVVGEAGGWAVVSPDGRRLKSLPLPGFDGKPPQPEIQGCGFDGQGRLFTTAGRSFGPDGALVVFFPPFYDDACVLDAEIVTPGMIALDPEGNVYVPEGQRRSGGVARYAPPFPAGAGECSNVVPSRSRFIDYDEVQPAAIARAESGHWYVSSWFLDGVIYEHDADGNLLREVLPANSFGNPNGLAVDSAGTLYFAEDAGGIGRIRFDGQGNPRLPEIVRGVPGDYGEGVAVLPRPPEHVTYGGSLERLFYNPNERIITRATAANLIPKWRYRTGAIITGQPAVAWLSLPEEGPTRVVYTVSWDGNVYALRVRNGSRVWQFTTKPHPGGTYPYASSPTVEWLNGRRIVLVGAGMTMYCLDAASGDLIWEFDAGTGCTTCDVRAERNQIESSPAVYNGLVYFGMDVNDSAPGKGGLYAVHLDDGRLAWYLDLETDSTCRPLATDNVRRFDGFHTAAELGLPEDFFSTRPGCDFDRTSTACGNVWSSASIDPERGLLFIASSNCDTDDFPETPPPPPPMPPYDRALFAVGLDGTPAWIWRPTEVDNEDFSFGAAPNLFEIDIGGARRQVVGVGNKNGTYYVVDRDGVNEVNGVTADDPPEVRNPMLPYWSTNVVPGGSLGGIIASSAVVREEGKVFFSTAPGTDPFNSQYPTAHALDLDDGSIAWQRGVEASEGVPPSFSPTVATPGLAYRGTLASALISILDSSDGTVLSEINTLGQPGGAASAPAIAGGMLFVGGGIGELGRPRDCTDPVNQFSAYCTAVVDTPLSAFCVRGTLGCAEEPACNDGNPCTYDYREDGECLSENAPDTIDCRMTGRTGRCSNGACVLP